MGWAFSLGSVFVPSLVHCPHGHQAVQRSSTHPCCKQPHPSQLGHRDRGHHSGWPSPLTSSTHLASLQLAGGCPPELPSPPACREGPQVLPGRWSAGSSRTARRECSRGSSCTAWLRPWHPDPGMKEAALEDPRLGDIPVQAISTVECTQSITPRGSQTWTFMGPGGQTGIAICAQSSACLQNKLSRDCPCGKDWGTCWALTGKG